MGFSVGGMVAIFLFFCYGWCYGQRDFRSVVKWSFGFDGILVGHGQWWRGGHGGVMVLIGLFGC